MKISRVSFALLVALQLLNIGEAATWHTAQASFYGTPNGSLTDAGACGYTNLTKTPGYGLSTTSVSAILFSGGGACGACYEVHCNKYETKLCKPNATAKVTVTNFCPESAGEFCKWPKVSLSLTQRVYTSLFKSTKPVVLPVIYKRVACTKPGFIKFRTTEGTNPYFLMILISNTAGAGDIQAVEVSLDGGKKWFGMYRNFGSNWSISSGILFGGKALSFRVTAMLTSERVTAVNVLPKNWSTAKVYVSKVNFKVSP